MTISCIVNDGQKINDTKHSPPPANILQITIFGPDLELLNKCGDVTGKPVRKCSHEITSTKDLGQFTYHCQFRTGISTSRCVSSKNLTVTGDGKREK